MGKDKKSIDGQEDLSIKSFKTFVIQQKKKGEVLYYCRDKSTLWQSGSHLSLPHIWWVDLFRFCWNLDTLKNNFFHVCVVCVHVCPCCGERVKCLKLLETEKKITAKKKKKTETRHSEKDTITMNCCHRC